MSEAEIQALTNKAKASMEQHLGTFRMKQLVGELRAADKAYYSDANPIMTDQAYDALYDELVALEQQTGVILGDSPSQKVGYEILSKLTKVTHPTPLLSLNKTKDIDELEAFLGEQQGMLTYKLDGLTILLHYNHGELKQAVTRGNGQIGEDVTHNARHFFNVPHKIPHTGSLHIRGEAAITYTDFEAINAQLAPEDKYKNPRNLCSGTVRQLDSNILAGRRVGYYAFSLLDSPGLTNPLKSQDLLFLKSQGFDTVQDLMVGNMVTNMTTAQIIDSMKQGLEVFDLPTDGLVLTYDDKAYSDSLGTTSKFPRDSMAFKWQDELATTTLTHIEWNTSRTGLINPIAVFEPVDLEGTEVKKASLHNLSILEELQLGTGDTITVYKANMIIPQVGDNLTRKGPDTPPSTCPECHTATTILEQNSVKTLYCTNPNCKAQRVKLFSHYVSRNAMNIEGLSEATLAKFIELGYLNTLADLYTLSQHQSAIESLAGFGAKSATKLLTAIERSKTCHLYQFIYGLGIFNVGLAGAKLLCEHFGNDIEQIKQATADQLTDIHGFGEVIARSLTDYLAVPANTTLIDTIYAELSIIQPTAKADKLAGMTFVATGSVDIYPNRKALQTAIESNGGKLTGSVTKNTTYLINNDKTSGSSKNQSANKLGIPILSEADFQALLGE